MRRLLPQGKRLSLQPHPENPGGVFFVHGYYFNDCRHLANDAGRPVHDADQDDNYYLTACFGRHDDCHVGSYHHAVCLELCTDSCTRHTSDLVRYMLHYNQVVPRQRMLAP